jgi:hypothetical protein
MKTNTISNETRELNALRYETTKVYTENGNTFRMKVKIQLADECKNGVCSWSVTADIDIKKRNGRYYDFGGGCCHEEILKQFPEFRKFVDLHLCDCYGVPLYAVENGYYFLNNEPKEKVIDYLRITEEEYKHLQSACDKAYFKFLLYNLGIVRRWNDEAEEAIKELEMLTGCKWVNPYEYDKERKNISITDEEANDINSGYYAPEAIHARKEEAQKAAKEKKRGEIIKRFASTVEKAERERDIFLYILDSGLPVDNVIYYDHTNKVVFNWLDYREKLRQDDFISFLNNVDYSKLPEGITFEIK